MKVIIIFYKSFKHTLISIAADAECYHPAQSHNITGIEETIDAVDHISEVCFWLFL